MATVQIRVPDIGGHNGVPVIEVLVQAGDVIGKDQGLVTLESDKATMEVPSSAAGKLVELKVKVGDEVSEGDVIAILEVAEATPSPLPPGGGARSASGAGTAPEEKSEAHPSATPSGPEPSPGASRLPALRPGPSVPDGRSGEHAAMPREQSAFAPVGEGKTDFECQLLVLGAGPGGYTAAFRGADLGLDTILVERYPQLGGVCLNVGCIPSKALLHAAEVIEEAKHAAAYGVSFGETKIDLDKLRAHKDKVVGQLTGGLAGMAKARKVRTVTGTGTFASPNELDVETSDGRKRIRFAHAIIAAGSQPVKLPGFPWDDARVMDSTDALMLHDIPSRLLVVGGGIIGLEMACVYSALGSAVTVVEFMAQLMPGADPDLVKPLADLLKKRGVAVHLATKVAKVDAKKDALHATFEGDKAPTETKYDRVLVSVGRSPNGGKVGAQNAGVAVSDRGFIAVDRQMRTNVPHIFAIGDLVGQPMLAHKATHEGKLAAEVAAGEKREWVARVIPSVAYTDPEIAWVGVTETEAKAKGLKVGVAKFPWAASGRAIGIGRTEGFTKLIFDEASHRVIGGGIVGARAGDLIAEVALAIEMGCEAGDIGHTIHPHPTLSESVGMAAEVHEGSITDLYIPRRK